jgi:hypothetical protein
VFCGKEMCPFQAHVEKAAPEHFVILLVNEKGTYPVTAWRNRRHRFSATSEERQKAAEAKGLD